MNYPAVHTVPRAMVEAAFCTPVSAHRSEHEVVIEKHSRNLNRARKADNKQVQQAGSLHAYIGEPSKQESIRSTEVLRPIMKCLHVLTSNRDLLAISDAPKPLERKAEKKLTLLFALVGRSVAR